ncbi:MAG: hydroxymyristoyl-ACP dehydratase [Proteobacteria bacterium]|nr:hydroxymyristoyl-ACP dehydratase [Pseudomonadota bacterium]
MGITDQIVAKGDALLELIPQRPPMIMIDSLLKVDEKEFETAFTIKGDNILLENDRLSEAGLIENVAQTSAAGSGQQYIDKNEPIPLGFIGAVQKLNIFHLPKIGDTLKTTVTLTHKVMNISVVKGIVTNGNRVAAQCDMKLFIQE